MIEENEYRQRMELCNTLSERENRRWALRRHMVKIAFYTLIAMVVFLVMVVPYTMDSDSAGTIVYNETLIKFILGCLTAIVMWYFGLSSVDDIKSKAMNVARELLK